MAPKRGGGGGSSSGGSGISISSCPGAFSGDIYSTPVVLFVNYVLFFVFTFLVIISMCCVWKRRGAAKKLAGPIFLLSLLSMLIGYMLLIIGTVLRECQVGASQYWYYDYYNWAIAWTIFFRIGTYLLLVVVVWGFNNLLRQRLASTGQATGQSFVNVVSMVVLGFMGLLTCAYVGLNCYNFWSATEPGQDSDAPSLYEQTSKLALSYYVFYLVSIVIGSAMAVTTIMKMRSTGVATSDLFLHTSLLTFVMFLWVLFTLIEDGSYVQEHFLSVNTYYAFAYLENIFQTLSWIVILFIAKSRVYDATAAAAAYNPNQPAYGPPQPGAAQQQYAYAQQPGVQGQQYYYQQQPVYNGMSQYGSQAPEVVQAK